jgi:hypothetical protein
MLPGLQHYVLATCWPENLALRREIHVLFPAAAKNSRENAVECVAYWKGNRAISVPTAGFIRRDSWWLPRVLLAEETRIEIMRVLGQRTAPMLKTE